MPNGDILLVESVLQVVVVGVWLPTAPYILKHVEICPTPLFRKITKMDHRKRIRERSDDEYNLHPPSKRVSRSGSPMASPSPSSITVEGISDRVGATSGLQSEVVMQELENSVRLSREMDVLYDPLEASGNRSYRTRVTPQAEANTLITEYDLPSLFFPNSVKDVWMHMLRFFSIIAVHGLGSTPDRAWVHKESGKNWLKDFLPNDLNHKARIMTYNHQSRWESYAFRKSFHGFSQDLLRTLEEQRKEVCKPDTLI